MVELFLDSYGLVLAPLAYLLVTHVLYTLAAYRRNVLAVHDRVRESKMMRREYLMAVQERQADQGGGGAIIEDDVPEA